MSKDQPALSVIIIVGDPETRGDLTSTMYSLFHQSIIDRIEVLLVDCSVPGTPPPEGSDHPSVRTIRLSHDVSLGHARAEGARQAHAPIVAFLSNHAFGLAGWAEAIVKAHEGPWAGVGGEIYNSNAGVGFSDPIYLMGHTLFLPPVPRGEAETLPLYDSSYKRDALLEYGDKLDHLLVDELVLTWKLREDGYKLFLEPDIKSMHSYTVTPKTLVAFYAWNRCFAYTRAEVFQWPGWKRALYIALMPLNPWWHAAKLFLYLVRKRPERLVTYFVGLPIILLAQYGAAVGRVLGMVCGRGNAEALFTESHLRGLRWRASRKTTPPTSA